MNKWLLHYDCIDEFNHQFNKDILTAEHLQTDLIELSPVKYENGQEEGKIWGWIFQKNGSKYLLASRDGNGEEIKLKKREAIKKEVEEVVNKNKNKKNPQA
jgi:hypothetical protein